MHLWYKFEDPKWSGKRLDSNWAEVFTINSYFASFSSLHPASLEGRRHTSFMTERQKLSLEKETQRSNWSKQSNHPLAQVILTLNKPFRRAISFWKSWILFPFLQAIFSTGLWDFKHCKLGNSLLTCLWCDTAERTTDLSVVILSY